MAGDKDNYDFTIGDWVRLNQRLDNMVTKDDLEETRKEIVEDLAEKLNQNSHFIVDPSKSNLEKYGVVATVIVSAMTAAIYALNQIGAIK